MSALHSCARFLSLRTSDLLPQGGASPPAPRLDKVVKLVGLKRYLAWLSGTRAALSSSWSTRRPVHHDVCVKDKLCSDDDGRGKDLEQSRTV